MKRLKPYIILWEKEMKETKKKVTRKKKFKFDQYINQYTGLGSRDRDKAVLSSFERSLKLSDNYLENLYHDSDIAARICDLLPEETLKRGYFIKIGEQEYKDDLDEYVSLKQQEETDPKIHALNMKLDELDARSKFIDAMIWSRVFGGAALYVGIDDGNAQEEAVDEARIQDIIFIKALDKRYIFPWEYYDNPNEAKFGEVKTYKIIPQPSSGFFQNSSLQEAIVHESRIISFQGTRTTSTRAQENRGWADSLLQKCDEVLAQFGQSWQATAHLMMDAAQGVFKMHGLVEALSSNNADYVRLRLQDTDMNRSIARMIAVDAESDEDFRRDSYSFNGIPQILELFMLRLSLAARIPVTILMGQSPAGMNATGESDIRWFYDTVQAFQKYTLKPKFELLVRYVMLSRKGPLKGKEPEQWAVCFPSPWQMNDFEQAEINKTRAETRKLLAEAEQLESKGTLPVIAHEPTQDVTGGTKENEPEEV